MPNRYIGSIINSDCEEFWDGDFKDFEQLWEENETPLSNTNMQVINILLAITISQIEDILTFSILRILYPN